MEENTTQPVESRTFEQIPVPTPPVPKRTSKLWYVFIALVVLLVLTVIATVVVYVIKYSSSKPSQQNTIQRASPTPNPTANWKTYEGEGFSFKYPSDWEFSDRSKVNFDPTVEIRKSDSYLNIYLEELETKGLQNVKTIREEDILVGNKSIKFEFYTSTVTKQLSLHSDLSEKTLPFYAINIYLDKETKDSDLQVLNQVLSTFKFTEDQTIDTSNWKTFTSTMEGFTLRYPLEWKVVDTSSSNCGHTKLNGNDCRERFDITSPDGVITARFVIHNDKNDDKIGCGIQAVCLPQDIQSIETIQTKEGPLLLIKTKEKTVHLHKPLSEATNPKLGINKFSDYMIDFSLPSRLGGRYAVFIPQDTDNTLGETAEYYKSGFPKIGLEILRSITFE